MTISIGGIKMLVLEQRNTYTYLGVLKYMNDLKLKEDDH